MSAPSKHPCVLYATPGGDDGYVNMKGSCKCLLQMCKARATPIVSVSVPVSVTRTRHFELHLTTISCQISHGLHLIWRDNTLH